MAAGKPSTRKIAGAVGGISHTTVNEMLRGARVPAWELVEKVGSYLGGDVGELRALWVATQRMTLPRGKAHDELWDPIYLDRIVVTSFVSRKGAREIRFVERWFTATRDAVDRYVVHAAALRGRIHQGGGKVSVEPYLNCTIGKVRPFSVSEGGDVLLVEVLLASPISKGERGFFATRTCFQPCRTIYKLQRDEGNRARRSRGADPCAVLG
ncbi:hypothetical protein [Amycolatopsis sp. cmx-4-68]|uniref:hypothetical protein n=1 Tax=Amycolatopsis sp. cmx-4-68 TaxID=2790938 RepID=UPI00397AD2E3